MVLIINTLFIYLFTFKNNCFQTNHFISNEAFVTFLLHRNTNFDQKQKESKTNELQNYQRSNNTRIYLVHFHKIIQKNSDFNEDQ